MPIRATVLIPTHDHGPTLRYALASARRQTVAELEILVVGDGAPPVTGEIVAEAAREDPRVRWLENPKGPRHGEIHRHAALAGASGEIVCYLSDDDLWLPEHVESMLELLATADFGHCLPTWIEVDGSVGAWTVDLESSADRELLLGGENRVPLSCSGHTLAAYRRLPHGWRTTPEGVYTDLYMFQQFLGQSGVRAASGTRPTCLHFPSPARQSWSIDDRCRELGRWQARIADAGWRQSDWIERVLAASHRRWAESERDLRAARGELEAAGRELQATGSELEAASRELEATGRAVKAAVEESEAVRREREAVGRRLEETRLELASRRQELESLYTTIHTSFTWRLRRRVLAVPLLGRLLRWAAAARARPGAR